MATSGVLITSDNNTICRNMISNCRYTVKLEGDDNTVYANNLFFTEAGNSPGNTLAIDTGENNHTGTPRLLSVTDTTIQPSQIASATTGMAG